MKRRTLNRSIYNFSLNYQANYFAITLRVNNLTNKYYYSYVVTGANNQRGYYPAATRNVMLTFKIKL